MTRPLPILTALFLALTLALTSVSMAVARGGMSLSGVMILCVDATQVIVPLDPDGRPRESPPACLDCTMGALAPSVAAPLMAPVRRARLAQAAPVSAIPDTVPARAPQARGPPPSA